MGRERKREYRLVCACACAWTLDDEKEFKLTVRVLISAMDI